MVTVDIVHRLPRRIRLRAPLLLRQRQACERIAATLVREHGCETVSIRPGTGSVVVEGKDFDPDGLRERLRVLIETEHDDGGRPLTAPRASPNDPDRLAKALTQAVRTLNARVCESLDGEVDLATLAPVILTGVSATEVFASGTLPAPSWSSLLWYSLQVFTVFKKGAIERGTRAPEGDRGSR